MSSYKYKHLTLDDRITIQKALKEGQTFVEIGALIGKDPSTVSKEVKAHLDYRNTGTRSRGYNPCRHRKRCTKQYICGEDSCGFINRLWHGKTYCSECALCMVNCPDFNVVEMDSVEGTRDSTKVLLTVFVRNCSLMLAYLREANTAKSVTEAVNHLYEILGREQFCEMFQVILADRGSEFTDPLAIEFDEDGRRRTYVFYCDPQRPDQKGSIEVTHEFIRRIVPKKTSFAFLTQDKVNLMMSHINSYTRKKLNNRSAHQLFSFFYGADTASKLNLEAVPANEIILKPELLK